jgi:hypothetical protein
LTLRCIESSKATRSAFRPKTCMTPNIQLFPECRRGRLRSSAATKRFGSSVTAGQVDEGQRLGAFGKRPETMHLDKLEGEMRFQSIARWDRQRWGILSAGPKRARSQKKSAAASSLHCPGRSGVISARHEFQRGTFSIPSMTEWHSVPQALGSVCVGTCFRQRADSVSRFQNGPAVGAVGKGPS